MKNLRYCIIAVLLVLTTAHMWAQDTLPYPSMKKVKPVVIISAQQVENEYQYNYSVSNGTGALQRIEDFMIQIRSASAHGVAPSDWWVSRATRPGLVAATWHSLDSSKDISPGSSLSGFQIVTSGLPAIVQFYAVGAIPIPYGEFIPQEGTDDIFINSAQGRTLGPLDPPVPFAPLPFLDTLIAMKNEAKSLGWIKSGDLSDLIDQKLDQARAYLLDGDNQAAKAELQECLDAVVHDCTAVPPTGNLSTEACALLQFNLEYLIKQLSG